MDILSSTKEARIYNGEKTTSLTSGAGKTGQSLVKEWKLSNKINSKWIKVLSVRPGTIKLLEENIGSTLLHINHSKILSDPLPRFMKIKAKVNEI